MEFGLLRVRGCSESADYLVEPGKRDFCWWHTYVTLGNA